MESVKKVLYFCDHPDFLKLTVETWQNRWFPSQVPLSADVDQIKQLNEKDLEFYKFLFTFLGMAESLVNLNIEDLLLMVESHDVKHYYAEQMAMENVHGKVYANILNMFFNHNVGEVYKYAENIVKDESLAAKINWLQTRVKETTTPAEKMLMFLLIEGIFFISSFYSIGLLRVRGILNGVCLANDYISRDELLHTRAAAVLYNTTIASEAKPPCLWVHQLFKEAVDVEHRFILAKSQGVTLVNTDDIRLFLEATADRILESIHLPPCFGSAAPPSCPLVYTGCTKSVNFFERDNSDYSSFVTNDL